MERLNFINSSLPSGLNVLLSKLYSKDALLVEFDARVRKYTVELFTATESIVMPLFTIMMKLGTI